MSMIESQSRGLDPSRVIHVAAQLHADAGKSSDELDQRDRAIAPSLVESTDRRTRILTWLDHASEPLPRQLGQRLRFAQSLGAMVLTALGLLAGAGASTAAFHYTGDHPVNIAWVLVVFVGIQGLTLVLTIIAMLPDRLRRGLPGLGSVQHGVMKLSPGRVVQWIGRVSPRRQHQLDAVLGQIGGYRALTGRMFKWLLLQYGQWFGLMFNLAALATALAMVTTSDLAFGWSTTLDVDASQVHHLTQCIAWPWAWLWPSSVPNPELVQATRYYRAAGLDVTIDPMLRGQWWSFLVTAMIFYGLLPRLLLWMIARWRLAAAVRWTFDHLPGLPLLERRLQAAGSAPPVRDEAASSMPELASRRMEELSGSPLVIAWADPPRIDSLPAVIAVHGANASQHMGRIVSLLNGQDRSWVLILTRAWEPPVAEFFDFVRQLREAVGQTRPIMVLPVGLSAARGAAPAETSHMNIWRRSVAKAGDVWTLVADWREVVR